MKHFNELKYNTKSILKEITKILVLLIVGFIYIKWPFYKLVSYWWCYWLWLLGFLLLFQLFSIFTTSLGNRIHGIEGEDAVIEKLENLPVEFKILDNLIIEKERGNVDQVVVGPTGVWVIETKSHEGEISFNGETILRDGRLLEKNFLNQAWAEAYSVQNEIKRKLNIIVVVQPVVVFSSRVKLHFGLNKQKGVYVIGKSWLNKLIKSKLVQQLPEATINSIRNLLNEYKE